MEKIALVMPGGGARAAYQVGLLRFLARELPDLELPILTGVSAGAINVAHLASRTGNFVQSVEELADFWNSISVDQVFDTAGLGLGRTVLRWGARLVSGGSRLTRNTRGLLDTAPLREFLKANLPHEDGELVGITRNLDRGVLEAVSIATTNYANGHSISWVQGRDPKMWSRSHRESRRCRLRIDHVMGSAALPIIFPAIKIGQSWHGDGGVRLTAPLSPALHLGATRVLTISTRFQETPDAPMAPATVGYPPPGQVAGMLLNAIFLDMIDADVDNMQRLNTLLERIPEEQRDGLRPVDVMVLRPSVDLGRLASQFEATLPPTFRFLTRGLGSRETKSPDSLSMMMFQHDYVHKLMEIGEQDAEARGDELLEFLSAGALTPASG